MLYRLTAPLLAATWIAGGAAVFAGNGVGELALDRHAVRDLLRATLSAVEREGSVKALPLQLHPPTLLDFVDGGIETRFELTLPAPQRWRLAVDARFEPRVDPASGTVSLQAVRVESQPALPAVLRDADWLPAVELPRRVDWELEPTPGVKLDVACFVQGVIVDEDRLRLQLGLSTR